MLLGIRPTVDFAFKKIVTASKLEQWAFLLLRAQDYEAELLKRLLPGIEFGSAINSIATISAKTEDKQMYDQREKAQRDYEWALSGAREQGREEGRKEGRKAAVAETVRMLEELAAEPLSPTEALVTQTISSLELRVSQQQRQLRERQV